MAQSIGGYEEIFYLDDDITKQKQEDRVIGGSDFAMSHKDEYDVIVAIGNGNIRRQIQEQYETAGVKLVSLIHPKAEVAKNVTLGKGTVIMAGAVVQSGVEIGDGVIVNTSCSVDHDCKIDDYSHIAVGSHLAGNVAVGKGTWIGAGAVVKNDTYIGDDVTVGAGAAVIKNITENGVYIGIPAKKIR